jgi:glycosyltransferase involved in cell wall biosynthesis
VATAVGGTPELVVHGKTGLLVPPGDVDALADALAQLLSDSERAGRMGDAGRARVQREFEAAATAQRVLELYAA